MQTTAIRIGLTAAMFAAICLAPSTGKAADSAAKRPNIIFILADDLGYGELGCYGQQKIRTPMVDAMAEGGLRFTHMHVGAPVCLPTRCTLMTGLHTGHCRCRANGGGGNHPMLEEEDTTVATVLKAAGYRTAMVGKWSLGDLFIGCVVDAKNRDGSGAIYKHGWDYYFGEPNQTYCHSYYPNQLYRFDRDGLIGRKTDGHRLDVVPLEGNPTKRTHYTHDLLTEQALAFIDAAKDGPFFLYLPYTIPHSQHVVPELEPYAAAAPWPEKEKVYASMISRMDRDVGRILERLKQHGIEKNTLVIFTSDNGPAAPGEFNSSGGLPGRKGSFEDGGIRVPCVAYWPGTIRAGRATDLLSAFWDFMPTFAELAGIRPPAPIDGISLVPTLLDRGQQPRHAYLFFRMGSSQRIIRGPAETRSDEQITREANTEVVVPQFTANRL